MDFELTEARIDALTQTISEARLKPYLESCENNFAQALHVYQLNAQLSESLYRPLQGLEISIRNALNTEFIKAFGEDWHDQKLINLQAHQNRELDKAKEHLRRNKKVVSNGGMVAELNFGFWVGTLAPKNDVEIWRKAAYKSFPNRPRGIDRKDVHKAADAIRRLRNRVFHHERIIHRNLEQDYETVIKIANWICPETALWINTNSEFDKNIYRSLREVPE